LARKKREIEKSPQVTNIGDQFVVGNGAFYSKLKIAIQIGGLIAVTLYVVFTMNLYCSAKKSNDLMKNHLEILRDEYDLLETQYKLSNEPVLYSHFVEKDYYFEYLYGKPGIAAKKRNLYAQKFMESKGEAKYLRVENPSPNMADQVVVFFYAANEKRLYGSSDAAAYIKSETEYVFPINRYYENEEILKEFLLLIYEGPECDRILESGHLNFDGENHYMAIVYKDSLGAIHLTKTEVDVVTINGESFIRNRTPKRYKL
jgi:hypothetical protein